MEIRIDETLKLLQNLIELDILIGEELLMKVEDVTKLQYLQNIIYETLRLHPPAPMLLPISPMKIAGRDPELWVEPTSFKPDMFENGPRIEEEEVDMTEGRGTLVPKAIPLEAK
ncbi:unnamed protein product [Sphenostylis stenocarpa]|uniref:Cytochrome P450 n=1 Tax=Sphenostylis stenocarpa TaxID=92480 RepID=A0AA86RU63_9FABA|nr:unnamed protein product [Sphenostylis stenocarpa]